MKLTGRRRFRKMNARFRQRGSAVVRERARSTSAGKARKLILNDFWGGDPLPLPPPVFSQRSLVGMNQRRRKYLAWLLWSTTAGAFDFARKHYRVGQRVRPCTGCPRCLTKYEATFVPGRTDRWRIHDKECRESKGTQGYCADGRFLNGTPCDGSGVISARPRVNAGSEAR